MKYSFILLIFLISAPLYASNCRKEVKQAEDKISQVDDLIVRATDYFARHEDQLNRSRIDMAKKYIDLGIERLETALSRFQSTENYLLNLMVNCSARHKTLNRLLEELKVKESQTQFRLTTYQNIAARF